MHTFPSSPEQIITLLKATNSEEFANIVIGQGIDSLSIQALKDFSAQFYASDPAKAKGIAQLTYEVSLLLPEPAPSLGIWTLANALVYTGEYSAALELYRIARAHYLAQAALLDAARLSVGLVFVLTFTGHSNEAIEVAHEAEEILTASAATEPADLRRLGNLLMNVGLLHEVEGRYEDALAVYERQAQVVSQLDDEWMLAQMRHNQACAFMRTNAWSDALRCFGEAQRLFQKNQASADLIRLYANQSELFVTLKRFDAASEAITLAQKLAAQTNGTKLQQQWLVLLEANLAITSEARIRQDLIERLRNAMETLEQSGLLYLSGLTAIALGRCFIQSGELEDAHAILLVAEEIAQTTNDRELLFQTRYRRAEVYKKQGAFEKAINHYEEAVHLLESIRQDLKIEAFRSGYLEDKLAIYQDLTRLCLEQERGDDAFHTIERARARLLIERMHFRLAIELENLGAEDNAEIRTLVIETHRHLEQLDKLYFQQRLDVVDASPNTMPGQSDRTTTIRTIEDHIRTLTHTLQRKQPLLSPLVTGQTAQLTAIQALLCEEILIEYFVLQGEVWAVIVQHDQPPVFRPINRLAHIERVYQAFAANIERTLQMQAQMGIERLANFMPGLIADARKRLYDLYQCLVSPLAALLPASGSLILSCENILHYIPFHALYNGTHYLCEQYQISYTPSATMIELCLKPARHGSGVLLCGYASDNLAAVNSEIAALGEIMPSAECLLGDAATTAAVFQIISQRALIHFATHASFRTDNPLLSTLKLADRGLSLAEIARLTLHAELVTLSGCETGYGQMIGADIVSLAAGFLGCGARSLLVSLWRVEDQCTSDFMAHFYRHLLKGASRSAALQMAQKMLLATGDGKAYIHHAHPAYWAPFILIGNPRPLSSSHPSLNMPNLY